MQQKCSSNDHSFSFQSCLLVHRLWLGGSVWLMTSLSDQYAISLSGKLDHAMIYRYQRNIWGKIIPNVGYPRTGSGRLGNKWEVITMYTCHRVTWSFIFSHSLVSQFEKRLTSRILARDDLWLLRFILHISFFLLASVELLSLTNPSVCSAPRNVLFYYFSNYPWSSLLILPHYSCSKLWWLNIAS